MYLFLDNKWKITAEKKVKKCYLFFLKIVKINSICVSIAFGRQVLQKSHTWPLRKKMNILYNMKQSSCWDLCVFVCSAVGLMDPLWIMRTGKMVVFPESLAKIASKCHLSLVNNTCTQYFNHTQVPLSTIPKHSLSIMLCRSVVGRKL